MRPTAAAAAALVIPLSLCAVDAGAVRSEDPDPEPPLLKPRDPCRPGSPEHREASAALEELRARLDPRKAPPPGQPEPLDLAPLSQSLRALLASGCYSFAQHEGPRELSPPSVAALRAWWLAGGHSWLRSYLHLGDPASPGGRQIVLPPEMPKLPSLGSAEKQIPPEMLCEPAGSCSPIAAGWQARAEAALRYHAVDNGRIPPARGEHSRDPKDAKGAKDSCLAELARVSAPERYMVWRRCVEQQEEPEYGLPFGSFRPLTRGWLIVRGRRGHYQSCEEVRAYDLATGAAFVSKDCSGLGLRGDGSASPAATARGRVATTEIGRLPLDALREAAWMLVLAPQVEAYRRTARTVPLPRGLRPHWQLLRSFTGRGRSAWGSSAQTTLSWSIVELARTVARGEQARTVARGRLTWPNSSEPGEHHAAQLLDVAERALAIGCPPAGLPASLPLDPEQPAGPSADTKPAQPTEVQGELAARLRQAASAPAAQPCFPTAP